MWDEINLKALWLETIKSFKIKHPKYSAMLREAKFKPIIVNKKANYYGRCDWRNKTVSINIYLHKHSIKGGVVNTMLHELAHAIDFCIRGKSNHDNTWRTLAKEIGCDGRTKGSVANKVEYPYVLCIKTENNLVFCRGYNRRPNRTPIGKYLIGKFYPINKEQTLNKLIVYSWKMWVHYCNTYNVNIYKEGHVNIKDFID